MHIWSTSKRRQSGKGEYMMRLTKSCVMILLVALTSCADRSRIVVDTREPHLLVEGQTILVLVKTASGLREKNYVVETDTYVIRR